MIEPLHDLILLQMDGLALISTGGIHMPETHEDPMRVAQGRVVAVGPGVITDAGGKRVPLQVRPGDRVLVIENAGRPIEEDGVKYMLFREPQVLAVTKRFES